MTPRIGSSAAPAVAIPAAGSTERERSYRRMVHRRRMLVAALAGILLAGFVLDVANGPAGLGLERTIGALFGLEGATRTESLILWSVRLPQALTALLVGAALALAGAEMQTILDNPLASPFTLGVSSAASFGAALAMILGTSLPGLPPGWLVPANAFVFAFGSVFLLQALASRRGTGPDRLVLLGIAMVFTFNALVALVQFVASEAALQQFVFWTMGSLTRTGWAEIAVLAAALAVAFPSAFAARWRLTALRFGEDRARSFGVPVARLRFTALLRVSLLAGLAVAFVGTVGFIGLVGPHIARLLVGEDHRFFLPASLLTGAAIMSFASLAGKLLVPGVMLPIGVVTSLVGIPIFVALILRGRPA
ncbi:iron ABC transporter permease (plasmid) [Azospirillum humicireducens]|uniref:Iron ABC transporter permease n=1 Tax=Azospirillum humicireducens TaxID=1226968 RepID=A0A2R4VV41_9PROT|nr:iron ABC transporter permease [Azospirillum humicireducens]AWB08326.1 iron ABC transporter permease [Azospirillum humicireducens]